VHGGEPQAVEPSTQPCSVLTQVASTGVKLSARDAVVVDVVGLDGVEPVVGVRGAAVRSEDDGQPVRTARTVTAAAAVAIHRARRSAIETSRIADGSIMRQRACVATLS
jgi:hypothetical protein